MAQPARASTGNRGTLENVDKSFLIAPDRNEQGLVQTYLRYRGATLSQVLDDCGGAGRGFDILRLALSILILLSHCSWIVGTTGVTVSIINTIFHLSPETAARLATATSTSKDAGIHQLTGLARPITLSYLPMFFALSGFLVTGSALRTRRLIPFLGLRVLRLLPALIVEVTLSAVVLGSIFTQLPLSQYYHSSMFWGYFLNTVGQVHFKLPGVFTSNTTDIVNSNLWTLPWELQCYIVMSAMIISKIVFNRKILTVLFVVATIALIYSSLLYDFQVVPAQLEGPALIYYFLSGVLIFLWRDKIVFHEAFFIVSAFLCYCLMLSSRMVFVYPLLLTYVTIYIGLFPFPKFSIFKSGDYSYGIYLYSFPVTQSLVTAFPSLNHNLPLAAPLAVLATGGFAALSWHCVEKHFLRLKRFVAPKSAKIAATLHPTAFSG